MDVPVRLWDSTVVLAYLGGQANAMPDCELIIQQCGRGELLLYVSTIAQSEVAFLRGYTNEQSEAKVREFFSRPYVKTLLCDIEVARESRRLIRLYKSATSNEAPFCPSCGRRMQGSLKPFDAVHMASALVHNVPILETYDPDLLKLDGKEGNPPLIIRKPLYEGAVSFPVR